MAEGTLSDILANENSLTGAYLSGRMAVPLPDKRRKGSGKSLRLTGATANNLQSVDAKIPLGTFTCISVVPDVMALQGYGRNNPYCSGIVILEEGPRISAKILGVDASNPQNIPTGMALAADFGEVDPEAPALAFRPA